MRGASPLSWVILFLLPIVYGIKTPWILIEPHIYPVCFQYFPSLLERPLEPAKRKSLKTFIKEYCDLDLVGILLFLADCWRCFETQAQVFRGICSIRSAFSVLCMCWGVLHWMSRAISRYFKVCEAIAPENRSHWQLSWSSSECPLNTLRMRSAFEFTCALHSFFRIHE